MHEISERQKAELLARYDKGASLRALATSVGVSTSTMSNLFDKWKVLKRRAGSKAPPTPENHSRTPSVLVDSIDRALAEKLYDANESLGTVADALGVSRALLRRALVEWEVPVRNRIEAAQARWANEARKLDAYRF